LLALSAGDIVWIPLGSEFKCFLGQFLATFTFREQDDDGAVNGGIDTDPVARTMIIDARSVNDAPTGADNTITTPAGRYRAGARGAIQDA